jgi:geranylgeranyl diphosphate synthase type I
MTKSAKENLKTYKSLVDKELEVYFKKEVQKAKSVSPFSARVIKDLRDSTLRGGKRLRAAFVYYAYKLLGGRKIKEIIKTSSFIEVLHSYLLIEDDIMDQSDTRRGGDTLHTIYQKYHKKHFHKRDPLHFGESLAITVGLVGCHLSINILNNSNFSEKYKVKAINAVNENIIATAFGQIHDILLEVKDQVKKEDILLVQLLKTAKYTYETPLYVGAILAGANKRDLKLLSEYAIPAGIAFQIQDDILGMFGDEERIGKPVDSDLKEGKQTLLIIKALERASKADTKKIMEALGNPQVTKGQLKTIQEIMIKTGSYDYSKKLARKYVRKAQKALEKMDKWNIEGKAFLAGIAQYMIERDI